LGTCSWLCSQVAKAIFHAIFWDKSLVSHMRASLLRYSSFRGSVSRMLVYTHVSSSVRVITVCFGKKSRKRFLIAFVETSTILLVWRRSPLTCLRLSPTCSYSLFVNRCLFVHWAPNSWLLANHSSRCVVCFKLPAYAWCDFITYLNANFYGVEGPPSSGLPIILKVLSKGMPLLICIFYFYSFQCWQGNGFKWLMST